VKEAIHNVQRRPLQGSTGKLLAGRLTMLVASHGLQIAASEEPVYGITGIEQSLLNDIGGKAWPA
jgi:hypothetical protein